jgi:dihydrofolate reductase
MRKVKLYIATSLDGKIARKDGTIDWLPDPTAEDYGYHQFYNSIDATLMGYKTYEICLQFGEWPYPGKFTYVFTRDSTKSVVPEANLITQHPVDFVRELRELEGKDIWLVGGGEIVTLLHDAGLIDEYILAYIPVILGEGIELFPGIKQQQNLQLTKHLVFSNGVVLLYLDK